MAESKHTTGPWHASRKSVYVSNVHNKCVAEIFDRHEANARLIAAAPELLEALNELDLLLDFGEPCSDEKPWIFDDWSDLNAAFIKARAAISKATGSA